MGMDLEKVQDVAESLGAEEGSDTALDTLLVKLGQYSEHRISNNTAEGNVDDIVAGIALVVGKLAVEEGVNLGEATEKRSEALLEEYERREKAVDSMLQAVRDGDYEQVAIEMGMVEDPADNSDDSNQRYLQ